MPRQATARAYSPSSSENAACVVAGRGADVGLTGKASAGVSVRSGFGSSCVVRSLPDVGFGLGVRVGVGSGVGVKRGSGKAGSVATATTWVFFHFPPGGG